MVRIYADFNDRTARGSYWNLHCDGRPLDAAAEALGLKPGDEVLLFQDEDDFEVRATLVKEHVEALGGVAWSARPDWSTMMRHHPDQVIA